LPCFKADYSLCLIQHFRGRKLMHFWMSFRLMNNRSRWQDNYITHLILEAFSAAAWSFSKDIHISIHIYMLYTTMNQKYTLRPRKQQPCAAQQCEITNSTAHHGTLSYANSIQLISLHLITSPSPYFSMWPCSKGFPSRFLHELPTQATCSNHLTLTTSIM
jgi:hypothetical protein